MDINEIRKWHKVFKPNNELFEIRILGDRTYSGYFYDVEKAIQALAPYDNYQIYFSVNEIKDACSGRTQFESFQLVKGSATSKSDIAHRWWLPIDIDVERPSNVSSSKEEKEYAHIKAVGVYKFLIEAGFPKGVVCDSSSGYHIYLPVDIDNTTETETIIKDFYGVLNDLFSDDRVKIDKAVSDANRIMRLYGTWGRKGRNSEERPHRMAKILKVPEINGRITIENITDFVSKYKVAPDNSSYAREYKGHFGVKEEFDLRKFISEHNIQVTREVPYGSGGTKFILAECPFDSSHKAPDSALFLTGDGKIGFKCLHNSCSDKDWRAFRLHFDPTAYDKKDFVPQVQQVPYNRPAYLPQKPRYEIKNEIPELGKKWFSMSDIQKVDLTQIETIKTGYTELDRQIVGLNVSEVTIISGSNSSGKSSWINNLILNVINQGTKVALWSGELPPYILKSWLQTSAAGMTYLKPSIKQMGKYYVPSDVGAKIDEWMDGKFFLYNNEYTNKWEQVFHDMGELVKVGVKLFILDNLFSLDIDVFEGDRNNKQKDLILQICRFAKENKIHLILVAHPRKSTSFLRKTDISGSGDLANAVDNIFIVHRVNNDFIRMGGEFLGQAKIQLYQNFGNCIEVAKNRMYGVVDAMVGMYYEIETRRFKNDMDENRRYGWEAQPQQTYIQSAPNTEFDNNNYYNDIDNDIDDLPY